MINYNSECNNLPFDLKLVKGYEQAMEDESCYYKPVNLRQYTQVGKLSKADMNKLNLRNTTPPEFYIFMNKAQRRQLEEWYGKQDIPDYRYKVKVFSILLDINPHYDFTTVTPDVFQSIYNSIRRLVIILKEMRSRCSNPNAQDWPWYGAKGVKVCDEWKNNTRSFIVWSIANGYVYRPGVRKGDQLSIDRIDSSLDYCPENCRWIPHRVNAGKAGYTPRPHGSGVHGRSIIRRISSTEFPAYRTKYGYLEWGRLFVEEFKGDWGKFNEYMSRQEFKPQTVYNIRTRIRDWIDKHQSI